MTKNLTKRQHYVPRTYLKHFAIKKDDKHFIHALPIADPKEKQIIQLSAKDVALEKHIHTLPGENDEEQMLLETFHARTDAEFRPILGTITELLVRELGGYIADLIRSAVREAVGSEIQTILPVPRELANAAKNVKQRQYLSVREVAALIHVRHRRYTDMFIKVINIKTERLILTARLMKR